MSLAECMEIYRNLFNTKNGERSKSQSCYFFHFNEDEFKQELPQCTSLLYSHEKCCIHSKQLLGSHKQTNILNMQFVHEEKYTVFTSNLSRKE